MTFERLVHAGHRTRHGRWQVQRVALHHRRKEGMVNAAMVLMMLEWQFVVRTVALGMIPVGVVEHDEIQESDIALRGLMLLIVAPELR